MADTTTPKFDDTVPLFEETQPIGEAAPQDISKGESFLKGAQQGVTLGGADELQGGVEAGLDKGQQLLNILGLTGPSPTQVNADLAQGGVKGNVGPQSTLDLYRQARDASRADFDAAQKANPGSYFAGGITGGLMTAPVMPGALSAPLGATKDLPLAMRLAASGVNAIPIATTASIGLAGGDIVSNPEQVGHEAANMIPNGIATAVGLTGLAEGGKALTNGVANKLTPDAVLTAYRRGKAGTNTTGQEFYDDVHGRVNDVVNEVADPIIAKSQAQNDAYNNKIANLDDQIKTLQNQQAKAIDLGKQRQVAQNATDIENLNKQTVETAKKTQSYLGEVKKNLGTAFDEIDAAAEKTGVAPENRDIIGNFLETVSDQAGVPDSDVAAIQKKLEPLLGQKDMQSFRNLKTVLTRYFENANPVIRRASKQAYSALKNNYSTELQANGFDELANKMAETNKRWGALAELQDNFVDNLNKNRITNQVQASPDTLSAMANFGQQNPKQMAQADFMSNLMKAADPQGSKPVLNQISGLAQDMQAAKNFTPDVPELPNPEIARLQNLLTQAKGGPNPTRVDGVDLSTDPVALKKQLTTLLPKYGMNTGNDNADTMLDQAMNFLKQEKGEDFVKSLQAKLKPLNEDVALRNVQTGNPEEQIPGTKTELLKKLIVGPTTKAANVMGRASKAIGDTVDSAFNKPLTGKAPAESKEFLQQGITHLSDATPEGIQQLSEQMMNQGETGKRYAEILMDSARKNRTSKNAVMFGLMQQPEFRQLMHKIFNTEEQK
jgi:hypothetical protein